MSSLIIQQNKDGFIIDYEASAHGELILDIISQEPIKYKHHMIIHNKIYDVYILYNYIKYKYENKSIAKIPHNNELFTEEILQEINNKINETYCSYKLEIIIEIIKLLKFPKETQEFLLDLKNEQRKIILEDYKMSILLRLIQFEVDSIIKLVSEFYYLFNNNISDKILKSGLEEDFRALILLSTNKMTECEHIIKFCVQIEGTSLDFIPDHLKTEEIIKLAVQNDGYALRCIPDHLMTEEIIKIAIQNKGYALVYVPHENRTEEIINLAIQNGYVEFPKETLELAYKANCTN